MSGNFGRYNPANYSQSNPLQVDVGLQWEYVRVINASPYLLSVSFGNQGTIDHPENYLEDYPITNVFNGKLSIVPVANMAALSISSALTSYISINAYVHGELVQPQAQPLTTLANVGNTLVQANQIFESSPNQTNIINASRTGAVTYVASMNNDGSCNLGESNPAILQVIIDNQGNLSAQSGTFNGSLTPLSSSLPVTLLSGHQETGFFGMTEQNATNASATGIAANFKTILTNSPTGITLTDVATLNAGAPAAQNFSTFGFIMVWTASANGRTFRYENYTTQGN